MLVSCEKCLSYLFTFKLLPFSNELNQEPCPLQVVPQSLPVLELLLQLVGFLVLTLHASQVKSKHKKWADRQKWIQTDIEGKNNQAGDLRNETVENRMPKNGRGRSKG